MKKFLITAGAVLAPFAAFAQNINTQYVGSVMGFFQTILGWIIPVLITIAVIVFFYEIITYIMATPEKKKEKRPGLLWSILALFIMISIFGIVAILQRLTGTQGVHVLNSNSIPTVQF